MILRPVPAHWFEAVVPRDAATQAIEALAATGHVEIECREGTRRSLELSVLREKLEQFRQIARRHSSYWPAPAYDRPQRNLPPEPLMDLALMAFVAWQHDAEHLINRLAGLQEQREEVLFCRAALETLSDAGIDVRLLQNKRDFLDVVCCCVQAQSDMPAFEDVLAKPFVVRDEACQMAVVKATHAETLVRQMAAQNVECTRFPDWLSFEDDFEQVINHRQAKLEEEIGVVRDQLDTLNQEHELAERLADVRRIEWLAENVEAVEASEHFAWLTGWTTVADANVLNQQLEKCGVSALVHFTAAPADASPPLMLRHRKWVRPFELFSRALGMPGQDEADPTSILAILIPLMFGYMFGDVGHGLVLLILGIYLQRRWEEARILILCGISAMVFGLLFGSLFARTDLIPALWMHPLKHPLLILAIPLVGAIGLLSGGILLNGLQTRWGQRVGVAWLGDLGFFLTYMGAVLAFIDTRLLLLAPLGLALYIWAHAETGRILPSVLVSLGHFVEMTFQILINTLSFLRVGAFALAHEGLSSAMSVLADATGNVVGFAIMMILGNILVIALEGLVVSIQTTRLVLFEFFVRFIRGTGRAFKPLPFPPSVLQGEQSESKS